MTPRRHTTLKRVNTGRCSLLSLQSSSEQYCRAGCLERPTRQAPGLLAGLAVPAMSLCPCVHAMPTCPRNLTRAPRHRAPDTWNRLGLAFLPSDVKCPPAVRPANQPPLSQASSGPGPRGVHLLGLSPEVLVLGLPDRACWLDLGFYTAGCMYDDGDYVRRELLTLLARWWCFIA